MRPVWRYPAAVSSSGCLAPFTDMQTTLTPRPASTAGYTVRHEYVPYRLAPAQGWYSRAVDAFEAEGLHAGLRIALGPEQYARFAETDPSTDAADALLHACLNAALKRQRRRSR